MKPKKQKEEKLVVRYSSFEGENENAEERKPGTSESRSHLKDELDILRLDDRQTVTFHLKRRTNQKQDQKKQEIQISEREETKTQELSENINNSEPRQTRKLRHRQPEKERYVALLRNRVMDVVKEIQKDMKKNSDSVGSNSEKFLIRPHTVNTGAILGQSEKRSVQRPCTHEGFSHDVALTSFRDRLTSQEIQELRLLLGDILRKKLRDGGWSRDGSVRSRDSSRATAIKGSCKSSATSSKRHKRKHERPPTRCTNTSTQASKADSAVLSERCLELLKEKLKESAAKVVRSRHDDVINGGDHQDLTSSRELARNQVRVVYNHESARPKLRLFALGNSSRNSTADWIMKQNFNEFKSGNESDGIKEEEKGANAAKNVKI